MFKLFLVAVSAALATATYNATWAPFANNPNSYLMFDARIDADAYYTTQYFSADSHEEYGVQLSTEVDFTFNFEIFSFYAHTMTVRFFPIRLVPYNQADDYVRPAHDDGQTHTYLTGFREVAIFDVTTQHVENMKTCTASILDTIINKNSNDLIPACMYRAKNQVTYMDNYWHWNLGMALGNPSWYGVQPYYSV